MKPRNHSTMIALLVLGASTVLNTFVSAQGSLTPTNAPTPTMKSLAQIEPRTDVLTLPGDSGNLYIISTPGSYYLSGNIQGAANKRGIRITTNNVALDLNGFSVNGSAPITDGISLAPGVSAISIRNGSLSGWADGVSGTSAVNCELTGLKFFGNTTGAFLGTNFHVRECDAWNNANIGIAVGSYCQVTGGIISGNGQGINCAGPGCLIDKCVLQANQLAGVFSLNDTVVENCIADGNTNTAIAVSDQCTVRNCTADSTVGIGISAGSRCRIEGCEAHGNTSDGIYVNSDCVVVGNHCTANGSNGIESVGARNRIEGNHVDNNQVVGIKSKNTSVDLTIRNSASGNLILNYSPLSGTTFGPVQPPNAMTNTLGNIGF